MQWIEARLTEVTDAPAPTARRVAHPIEGALTMDAVWHGATADRSIAALSEPADGQLK